MTIRRKKLFILSVVLAALIAIPFGVWESASPKAKMQAQLSWPLWPGSRERLSKPSAIPDLVRFMSSVRESDRESDRELYDRAHEMIRAMGAASVRPIVSCFGKDGYDAAYDLLLNLDLRAMEPMLEIELESGARLNYQFVMITASHAASSPPLSEDQLKRTLGLLEKLGTKSEHEVRVAGFCLGFWIYDDGRFIDRLSRSPNPRLRETAAVAAAKGLERMDHQPIPLRLWIETMHEVTARLLFDDVDAVSSVAAYAVRDFDPAYGPGPGIKAKLKELESSGGASTRASARSTLGQGALK